ncbi:MepB family protein [Streptococcus gordonii]|uniref:MepB family protein n=1 Tax=Streptococcus gordonii TaxID=1302 RepID=UPI0039BF5267
MWLLSSSTTVIAVYLSFPKRWLSVKRFSLQRIIKERWLCRFYPPWCSNLNKTAQRTQKWQLDYFQKIELEE